VDEFRGRSRSPNSGAGTAARRGGTRIRSTVARQMGCAFDSLESIGTAALQRLATATAALQRLATATAALQRLATATASL